MAASSTPELFRLSSTLPLPLEYFTDSTNTINTKSDVILKVADQKFYCHRLLLSLVSPVFSRMFDGQFREHDQREIILEGKTSESILELLKYIYPQFNGQITDENIEDFLQLADEYMIEHLKQPCKNVLLKQLEIFKYALLPTKQKLEQPPLKSENFHASDSALNSSRGHDDHSSIGTRHLNSTRRPTSSSRNTSSNKSSTYLKPGDKHGSSSNTSPRYVVHLDKTSMPIFYDKTNTCIPFTNNELQVWLRRLRILYQIDKGRNYGEVIDYILSILQFIPAALIFQHIHTTQDTYAIDEVMRNDIARARMHLLEEWACDGNPYRSINLTEDYRTLSLIVLINPSQSTITSEKSNENTTENIFQPTTITLTDTEDIDETSSTNTDN